ncbi:hypothetical protein [Butyrivibrio sp. AE3004]|uniref:hypothetical protein n=1 Tax=Butyrivibrio sp. AE3004 TaxID=1506994 RepID=UPI000A8AE8F3|nr:hypothetical protein [Butyrivibrio sp. AE3004]
MNYCAASLRDSGEEMNNDGLMIKGIHADKSSDYVIMVLSSDKKNGKLCDKIVRTAEKAVNKVDMNDMKKVFERLFMKFRGKGIFLKRKNPDITVLVLKGINYYVMNRGDNKIMRVGRLGAEEIVPTLTEGQKGDYYYSEGRLPEGSTLIAANSAFFERQMKTDIHKRLCPQMCVDGEAMQNNIEYLRKLLWSRGEGRPVTAAAVCVR